MNREMEQDFKAALEQEMRALMVRERSNHNLVRMRVEAWKPGSRRGGWILTPGGTNPTLNGNRIIELTRRITINGRSFRAAWNTDLPRHAILTARFLGSGNPAELVNDPFLGLVATNEWPEDLQGQVRFLSSSQEERPNSRGEIARLIRFEASEEVVSRIQAANGTIYLGFGKATIENNRNPVKRGSRVVYKLQK